MSKILGKVLVTNPKVPQIALDILKEFCDVIVTENDSKDAILAKIQGVDALFWTTGVRLNTEILDKAGSQMKIVGVMSSGIDHIDVPELKKRGIAVANNSGVVNNAVADVAVMLALAASRRLNEARKIIDSNNWKGGLQWMLGQDIAGSTVGIVGLGGIGQAIVKRLKPFEVIKFLYTGHREKKEGIELGARFVSLDVLVKESDFVIIACPLTLETKHMFDDILFSKMKKTAVLVNIARGLIVDQDALIRALKEGKIFAAGLDVMTPEPLPADHELISLPNCVILPHLGTSTFSTTSSMAELTAKNILKGLKGEEMLTAIN